MKPVIIHADAELELLDAVAFYEERSEGLGLELEEDARRALAIIQQAPERWPLHTEGARRYVIQRFPYAVYYLDLPEKLWVVAFAHTRRKPGFWTHRVR